MKGIILMENASKALLIAGEVLIGIIILSIMAALFTRMGEISYEFNSKAEKKEIVMFNTEYSKYETTDDKPYLTPEEVVTLINKTYSWNRSTYDETEKISLKVNNEEIEVDGNELKISDRNSLIEFLIAHKKYNEVYMNIDRLRIGDLNENELKELEDTKFTCEITYNGPKGRIDNIIIDSIE